MTLFDLNQAMEDANKAYGLVTGEKQTDGAYFTLKEGENKVRLLTALTVFPQHFNKSGYTGICLGKELGCPGCSEDDRRRELKMNDPKANEKLQYTRNIKWMCWVLDCADGEIKLAKLAHRVAVQLQTLQNNPEYAFNEAPMPYDITINAKNAGKTTVEYLVTASRLNTPVAEDVLRKLEKENTPEQIKEFMKNKKARELGLMAKEEEEVKVEYPEEEIDPSQIPF